MSMGKIQYIRFFRKAFICALAVNMMILTGCGVEQSTAEITASPSDSKPVSTQPSDFYASMFLVGDSCISKELSADAENNGFHTMFASISKEAEGYDLKYYSQDTPAGFNNSEEAAEVLMEEGFNLVSLANEHVMNQGEKGIESAISFWNAHPEAVVSGVYTSQQEQQEIAVHEINGISYAFLSWTYGTDEEIPAEKEYLVNIYTGHEQEMLDQVQKAKSMADIVIVAMHWGKENRMTPDPGGPDSQMKLAVDLSDAGADVIIGTHPYVIEPVAWINNRTICFYSMGNLLSSLPSGMPMNGIQVETGTVADQRGAWVGLEAGIRIHKSVKNGEIKTEITDVKTDLIYSYRDENNQNYQAVPFSSLTYEQELNKDTIYNAYKPFITMYDPTIEVGMH